MWLDGNLCGVELCGEAVDGGVGGVGETFKLLSELVILFLEFYYFLPVVDFVLLILLYFGLKVGDPWI